MEVDEQFQAELERNIPNYKELLTSRVVRILWELYTAKETAVTEEEKRIFQSLWDNDMINIRKNLYLDEEEKSITKK